MVNETGNNKEAQVTAGRRLYLPISHLDQLIELAYLGLAKSN
jgi:hypothetical protein